MFRHRGPTPAIFALILAIAPFLAACDRPPARMKVTAVPSLRLRGAPSTEGAALAFLSTGEIVTFIEEVGEVQTLHGKKGRWARVKYGDQEGFLFGVFLEPVDVNSGQGQKDEIRAVALQFFPPTRVGFAPGPQFGPTCFGKQGCPISDRLADHLAKIQKELPANAPMGVGNLLCRCQNVTPTPPAIEAEVTSTGGIAHVSLRYGPGSPLRIDLVILQVGDRLLVDDEYCSGRPATSIYTRPDGCEH